MRLEKAFTFEKIGRFSIYVDALNVFNWVNIQAYYVNSSLPQTQIAWERDGDRRRTDGQPACVSGRHADLRHSRARSISA